VNHKINLEEDMNDKHNFEKKLSYICWGLLLIWWGLRWSVLIELPEGSGLIVTSLIFLGANFARKQFGLQTLRDNTFIGLFSLLSGGALFVFDILDLPYQTAVFETLMITLGVMLLGYGIYNSNRRMSESQ
jgi:hypothetical protein